MRILILHSQNPLPADNGGKLRAAHVAQYLARRHEVIFTCFTDGRQSPDALDTCSFMEHKTFLAPPRTPWWQRLASRFPSEVLDLRSDQMERYVSETIARFDPHVLLTPDPAMASYLKQHTKQVRVLDYLMVLTLSLERMEALQRGIGRIPWRLRWRKQEAHHRHIAQMFDLCLVNSEEDRDDLLARGQNWKQVEFLPNGLCLDDYPLDLASPEPKTLVYPGSVRYAPNRDAVQYFIDDILPLVRKAVPGVRLLVTGAVPDDGSAPRDASVVYTGHVDDVRKVIAGAWACVVPLRSGAGGARYKVLESLALATPIVSTSIGAEGIHFKENSDLLLADDPQRFAEATIELLQSPERRFEVASAGRKLIETAYNWEVLGERVVSLFEKLIEQKQSGG